MELVYELLQSELEVTQRFKTEGVLREYTAATNLLSGR